MCRPVGNIKNMSLRFCLSLFLTAFSVSRLFADVAVTEPTGGNSVPTDVARNSTNGAAFVSLGNIVLTEGAKADFAVGPNQTIILTGPDGWQFNPGVGSVAFLGNGDITAASISVSSSNIIVTVTVGGVSKSDTLTISGVLVQPLDGTLDPNAGYILRLSSNPGTEDIAGILDDTTTFGLLNTVPGAPKQLRIVRQPSPSATAGVVFSTQPDIQTFDQFGNQCYLDTATLVTASRQAGAGTLQGATNLSMLGGEASFVDLSENVANSITILFSATGLPGVTSAPVVVAPAAASLLVVTIQPGSAQPGATFAVQPA